MIIQIEIPDGEPEVERVMRALITTKGTLSTGEAALMLNVGAKWFPRKWKRLYGRSFRDAKNAIRLEYAQAALLKGRSVSQIAMDLGYDDLWCTSFSRWFKRHRGMRPSDLYKQTTYLV